MNIDTFQVNKQETAHVHVISPPLIWWLSVMLGLQIPGIPRKHGLFFVAVDQKHKYISVTKSSPSVFKSDNIKLEHW